MGHHCCNKQKVKRGLWSPEEDEKLITHITLHGHSSWSSVPKLAGLQRCGKSCRLRWINYLRPELKRGSFTEEEERTIIEVHRIVGNRWAQIAKHLPGRTDNEVKNFWNSCIKKKLLAQGLDPNTHNLLPSNNNQSNKTTSNTHRISSSNCSSLVFSDDYDQNEDQNTTSIINFETQAINYTLNKALPDEFPTQVSNNNNVSSISNDENSIIWMMSTAQNLESFQTSQLQVMSAASDDGGRQQEFDASVFDLLINCGFQDYNAPSILPAASPSHDIDISTMEQVSLCQSTFYSDPLNSIQTSFLN